MKNIYLSTIFLGISFVYGYGQSKKDLHANIDRMRVDSINQSLNIKKQQEELKERNDVIIKLNQKTNKMRVALDTCLMSISELSDKIKMLNTKQGSLLNQLELALKNQNKTSYINYGMGEDSEDLEPLGIQNEFDFEYVYSNGNGFNPPVIFPIGWSYDGKIAYKVDYCNGGCGCCSSSIIVKDLNSNRIIKDQQSNTVVFQSSGKSIWSDYNYRKSVIELVYNYEIIPFGFGEYNTSKFIKKNEYDNTSIEIILEIQNGKYELKTKQNGYSAKLEYKGDLGYNEAFEHWNNIEYVGYFKSEINNYAAIVLMHISDGFEGEIDYNIELIGIKLPD